MTIERLLVAVAACVVFAASVDAMPAAEARTAQAVIAADKAWGAAESRGDTTFVDHLLLPGYQSVGASGTSTPKDKILSSTIAHRGSKTAEADVAAWKAAHPVRSEVRIFGDTAVLTWISTKPDAGDVISSCDVFVYRDGHWHAIYFQHSSASS